MMDHTKLEKENTVWLDECGVGVGRLMVEAFLRESHMADTMGQGEWLDVVPEERGGMHKHGREVSNSGILVYKDWIIQNRKSTRK